MEINDKAQKIQAVRNHNMKIICRQLLVKTLSGAELAPLVKISTATVSKILRQMTEMQIVYKNDESEEVKSVGRHHERYEINGAKICFVCVNLTYMNEFISVCDFSGKEIVRKNLNLPYLIESKEIDSLFLSVDEAIGKLEGEKFFILSVPSQVDVVTSKLLTSSRFKSVIGLNFKQLIRRRYNCDCLVANDVNFMLYGEKDMDLKNRYSVYCFVGYGMAMSILCDGKVLAGSYGYSGEIGKNVIDNDLLKNRCGAKYFLSQAKKFYPQAEYEDILRLYYANPDYKQTIVQSADYLAQALCNFCNILAVDSIVFGGMICDFDSEYFAAIENHFNAYSSIPVNILKGTNNDPKEGMFIQGFEYTLNKILKNR